jgi:hypothetical protein
MVIFLVLLMAYAFGIAAWSRGVLPPLLSNAEQASSTVQFTHSEASSVEELELREIPPEDQSSASQIEEEPRNISPGNHSSNS